MRRRNVLFLCTGNSARSIMAEAMLNRLGGDRFRAYSAGSHPTGRVNPLAIETLQAMEMPAGEASSKSWDQFAQAGAPAIDFIFTVCDNAAGETCPVWPGKPITAHWGVADPAAVVGSDGKKRAAFRAAAAALRRRIELFLSLPVEKLDAREAQARLREIGRTPPARETAEMKKPRSRGWVNVIALRWRKV